MSKATYINLQKNFWQEDAKKHFSAPVTRLYFYLHSRVNENRWEPVFISDVELSEATGQSRRRLPEYRDELAARGLISFQKKTDTGQNAGIIYSFPGTAPKGTVNCAERNSSEQNNCAKRNSSETGTAPKGTVNCAERNSLEPSAPINVSLKTSLRPSTTTEDMRASAPALTRDAAAVEVETVEVLEIQEDGIVGAADRLLEKKKKAASQGTEVLKAFFHESNRRTLETLCMQNRINPQELKAIAGRIVDEWIQDGKTHDDPKGNFNISDALKHLRITIPIKKGAEARTANAPKTREQHRQELINAAYVGLQQIMNGDLPEQPEEPAPF